MRSVTRDRKTVRDDKMQWRADRRSETMDRKRRKDAPFPEFSDNVQWKMLKMYNDMYNDV